MKLIISESQFERLFEQPDEKFDSPYNKKIMRDYNRSQNNSQSLENLSFDDTVDVISGIIDGIPGLGNAISAGIDIAHALAYGVKFFNSNDENDKIENATLGIITLGAAAIPVQGNALPIIARRGLKEVLKKTPQEILLLGKQLGLYKKTIILLSKTKWKYNLLLVLAKICGGELLEILSDVVKYIKDLIRKINNVDIKKSLQPLLNLLNEILSDTESINTAIEIAKKLK